MRGDEPTELLILPFLRARRTGDGGLVLTRKYLEGLAEHARSWPGPVATLLDPTDVRTGDMDHVEVRPGAEIGGVRIEERPTDETALLERLSRGAAVLARLMPDQEATARLCRRLGLPVVFLAEYTPRTERQIVDAEVGNRLVRLRRKLWLRGAERIRRRMLKDAAGLQCSGTPVFDAYAPFNANRLLFFDNRVRGSEVVSEDDLAEKLDRMRAGRPLRLAFGGRLTGMKGVLDLLDVAAGLRRLGAPFTLEIYGGGPLEEALRAGVAARGLGGQVFLRGVVDFQTGWIPYLRREVDLFVCCHVQGDPSSTYPEVMSCGVPIAGYDNEAFAGVLRHSGGGWACGMGDAAALAALIARLDSDREAVAAAARRARAFAAAHVFEATFLRRTEHLMAASRLPERLRPA